MFKLIIMSETPFEQHQEYINQYNKAREEAENYETMNELEQKAKEISKEIFNKPSTIRQSEQSILDGAKMILDFANSLTPQPIKVDAERPKGLTLKHYWNATTSEERVETIERTFEYVGELEEFIKRQKESETALRIMHSEEMKENRQLTSKVEEIEEQIQQLKSKADRDNDGYDKDRIEMMDKIKKLEEQSRVWMQSNQMNVNSLQAANKELSEIKEGIKYSLRLHDKGRYVVSSRNLEQLLKH